MKILMVADGHGGESHELAYGKSFESLGHKVNYFTWKEYFKHYQYSSQYKVDNNKLKSIYYRLQNKTTFGPSVNKLNNDLVKKCEIEKPNLVFIYRGTHIYPSTIKKIKSFGCKVFGYNNDDPFSKVYRKYFWRHFKRAIPFYDHIFYYRHKNMHDYESIGYKNITLLRSSFIKERNFKIDNIDNNKFKSDVVFIGHYENDGRDKAIKKIIDAGVNIKLFGTLWNTSKEYYYIRDRIGDIKPLYGDDYNLALNSSKIALVFLSKINNDTYTRRCFEIPATGTLMLAERTDDLAENLFLEDKEAVYFENHTELLTKINLYLEDSDLRNKIAKNGYEKVNSAGHEVLDRAKKVLEVYSDA